MMRRNGSLNVAALAAISLVVGCTADAPTAPKVAPSNGGEKIDAAHPHDDAGHRHGAGPHGGTLADWGGGKYHVEFMVDHDKQEATVYILGGDEKTAAPVKAGDGKLLLTIKEPSFQVDLAVEPLEGETADKASRFVGRNEKLGIVREFAGTISGEVDGTPFSGDFKEEPHAE